jgi:hypothetical protein
MEIITPGPMRRPAPRGKAVRLNGSNSLLTGKRIAGVSGGFGITEVDEEFWNAWYERNKDMDFIKSGAVFMHKSASGAAAISKERAGVVTGLEPINPDGDARMPHGVEADKEHLRNLGATVIAP